MLNIHVHIQYIMVSLFYSENSNIELLSVLLHGHIRKCVVFARSLDLSIPAVVTASAGKVVSELKLLE